MHSLSTISETNEKTEVYEKMYIMNIVLTWFVSTLCQIAVIVYIERHCEKGYDNISLETHLNVAGFFLFPKGNCWLLLQNIKPKQQNIALYFLKNAQFLKLKK